MEDLLYDIQQTKDDGYILGGYSASYINGDKTQDTWGAWDYWIVKTDSLGTKQWDKDFGGTDGDFLYSIQQTSDGGYILGGISSSNISGDKTQNTRGTIDYWIVKTDSLGNKLWDKDFGGTDDDLLHSIQQTADGGYILGGWSQSNLGGDKTQNVWGIYPDHDFWIVKVDSIGNKQWDKDIGGTDDDELYSIQQTRDGGYILGGYSQSNISGDKSQNVWGGSADLDYWIVKLDSLGIKQWDKDFGGTVSDWLYSLQQTTDGGYILGGSSWSNISGNKTNNTQGSLDYWIIKTDSLGNMEWDKDFGGTDGDEFFSVSQTLDEGYLISGTSYSPVSGDKTESNIGQEQMWILKTDSLGKKLWDKTILTTGHDEQGLAIQTREGCYVFANFTDAGFGAHKTQPSQGFNDYWFIKFCERLQANFTSPTFICPGSCIDFINFSFQATSYQWSFPGGIPDTSTAITPTNICYANPGSYDVQLIASNANGSDTLLLSNFINVYSFPPAQSIIQNGDTLFANAGSANYQWYFNSNIISGATNYFYVADTSGNYNVVATDTNGCEVEAVINNVIAAAGSGSRQSIQIYPNPVTEKLFVNSYSLIGTADEEISIFNLMGEKIEVPVDSQQLIVDCRSLQPGIYYIEIVSDKKIYRTKFLKQ